MNNDNLKLSIFSNKLDTTPKVREIPPGLFIKGITRDEKDGVMYCPAIWHEGSTRGKTGIDYLTAIALDYDGAGADLDATLQQLDGIECVYHTTHSNRPGKPKCRVLLPLTEPATVENWPLIHRGAVELAGREGLDLTCSQPERAYYWPSWPAEFADYARTGHQPGRRLTVSELLEVATKNAPETAEQTKNESGLVLWGVNEGGRNAALTKVAGSVIAKGMNFDEALQFCRTWNQRNSPPLADSELERTVRSIYERHQRNHAGDIPKAVTDTRIAELFANQYRNELRWLHEARKWLKYDGRRWCTDTPGGPFPDFKVMIRNLYEKARQIPDDTQRQTILKALVTLEGHKKQETVLAAASVVPSMIVNNSQLDHEPMALNCLNGTLDLTTGRLRQHTPEDFITRLVDINYDQGAQCPEFLKFLAKVLDGKQDLIDYLQRFVGYCLTGKTTEQVLLFLYGTGANGKTTLANTIEKLLGDFSTTADRALLMHRDNTKGSNDLAGLKGARLVKVSELNDGERLDEAAVKTMTGGDKVSCRFLYGEYFDYLPAFKILLLGNYKPKVRGRDNGIWRRIHLLPFNVTIPPEERDPELMAKLQAELPGVLAWAVRGCIEWQRGGLKPPPEVREEIEAYRKAEDIFSQWVQEHCITGEGHRATASSLLESFKVFSGWRNITPTKFGRLLAEAGFANEKSGKSLWVGICLINQQAAAS